MIRFIVLCALFTTGVVVIEGAHHDRHQAGNHNDHAAGEHAEHNSGQHDEHHGEAHGEHHEKHHAEHHDGSQAQAHADHHAEHHDGSHDAHADHAGHEGNHTTGHHEEHHAEHHGGSRLRAHVVHHGEHHNGSHTDHHAGHDEYPSASVHEAHHEHDDYAHCHVSTQSEQDGPSGCIFFRQLSMGPLEVHVMLSGFDMSRGHTHNLHIHEHGDLHSGCASLGGHFNPHGDAHGAPGDGERHVGDLGSINCDASGDVSASLTDTVAQLTGPDSIMGRSIAIHAAHSASIMACCVIGHASVDSWSEMSSNMGSHDSHMGSHDSHDGHEMHAQHGRQ